MDDYGYSRKVIETVSRIEAGSEQRGDREFLQEAMTRIPVSSPTYQRASQILKQPAPTPRNSEGSGSGEVPVWSPGMPTNDWMMAFQGGGQDPKQQEEERLDELYGAGIGPREHESSVYQDDPFKEPVPRAAPPAGVDSTQFMPGGSLHQSFAGGGGPTANSLFAPGANMPEDADFRGYVPEGYSFSDASWEGMGMLANDPSLMAKQMYSDNPMQASSRQDYIEAAMTLAKMGVIGGNGATDFSGGASSDPNRLAAVEDFVSTYDQKGQYIDPGKLYQDVYSRASTQNYEGLTDQNGEAYDQEDVVGMTNQALMSVAPFATADSQAWLSSQLERAALNYRSMLANGEVSMTYPKYLESIGAKDWIK